MSIPNMWPSSSSILHLRSTCAPAILVLTTPPMPLFCFAFALALPGAGPVSPYIEASAGCAPAGGPASRQGLGEGAILKSRWPNVGLGERLPEGLGEGHEPAPAMAGWPYVEARAG